MKINDVLTESPQLCPECGGVSFSDMLLAEKKDACYYKVKASAKVWPSAYASGRLVQCRKKGADNYGKSKNEGVAEATGDDKFDSMMGKISSSAIKQAQQQRELDTIQSIADAMCNDQKCDYNDLSDQDLEFIAGQAGSSIYNVMAALGRQQFHPKRDIGKRDIDDQGVAEGLNEFDAQGFQQRYTLYKDGYEIEKFGDMDDAIEYAEDDRRDGDDPSAVYKIVDINKQVVWDSDPYEKPSRIQLRKPEQGVAEGRTKAEINFDIKDIKRLEQINNLESIKQQAFELISRPSAHPMKPEKVSWFRSALERMDSPMKVIKLMYDLYLSGEGKSVLGTRHSMDPNSYRRRFGESQADENPVTSAIYRRLMNQKPDLFTRYGLEYVAQAVEDVADSVGRLGPDDEIGSSDVSGWVRQVEQNLRDRINQYDEPMTDIDRMEETHRPGHQSNKNPDDLIGGRYDPDEFDQMVLRLKQMAQKQERERGPVDLKDLARRLRGADNA